MAVGNTNQNINTTNKTSTSNTKANNENTVSAKCWQIEYYRPYFDVDTTSLLSRLKKSMIPTSTFLDKEMNEQPDLLCLFICCLYFCSSFFIILAQKLCKITDSQNRSNLIHFIFVVVFLFVVVVVVVIIDMDHFGLCQH